MKQMDNGGAENRLSTPDWQSKRQKRKEALEIAAELSLLAWSQSMISLAQHLLAKLQFCVKLG